jgi:hypothetical protein
MNAKFQIGDILPIALTLVVAGIGLAYGLNVMGSVKTSMTANSVEYNATADAIEGVAKIPENFSLIATIVVAAILIGILVRYLVFRNNA